MKLSEPSLKGKTLTEKWNPDEVELSYGKIVPR